MSATVNVPLYRQRGLSACQTCLAMLSVALVTLLGGCAAFDGYPRRATDPNADLAQLSSQIDAKAVTACLAKPNVACRNQIMAARMYANDILFSQFEEQLFRETRSVGFGSTLMTLGLTTAAAASSAGTSQVLSGIAAFIIGGREAFQKEVLAERTVIAIHTAMRAQRAQVALRLRAGMGLPIERYPLSLGLGDLNEYYNAGTVLGALVGITQTVGVVAQKAEEDLRLQTTLSFRLDAPGEKFEQAVCGGVRNCPTPDIAKFPKIKACWPDAGVPPNTLMIDFILQPAFATQRGLVAACMGL